MFLPFQVIDETSNDSICSIKSRPVKRESVGDYLQLAASLDKFFRQPDEFDPTAGRSAEEQAVLGGGGKVAKGKSPEKLTVPTRSRVSSEELLRTKKEKQKKKKDKSFTSDLVMDQVVQSQVDAVLLDCLEEELPTVPFDGFLPGSDLQSLLDTYQSCKSMNVCNSRWLRPSRPVVLGGNHLGDESSSSSSSGVSSCGPSGRQLSSKKSSLPVKPKRLVIYKEDLPGFKFDNDIELEKLPVSKRCLAKSGVIKDEQSSLPAAPVIPAAVEEAERKPAEVVPPVPKPTKKTKGIKREVFISRKEKKSAIETSLLAKPDLAVDLEDDTASVSSNASGSSRYRDLIMVVHWMQWFLELESINFLVNNIGSEEQCCVDRYIVDQIRIRPSNMGSSDPDPAK
jgi:hypothetical protein